MGPKTYDICNIHGASLLCEKNKEALAAFCHWRFDTKLQFYFQNNACPSFYEKSMGKNGFLAEKWIFYMKTQNQYKKWVPK